MTELSVKIIMSHGSPLSLELRSNIGVVVEHCRPDKENDWCRLELSIDEDDALRLAESIRSQLTSEPGPQDASRCEWCKDKIEPLLAYQQRLILCGRCETAMEELLANPELKWIIPVAALLRFARQEVK